MSTTTADYLLERLSSWGVRRIYGYPGGGGQRGPAGGAGGAVDGGGEPWPWDTFAA